MDANSSTGLSWRTAALLAYSGWCVTGLLFWAIERRDLIARFHAAQAIVAFGVVALVTLAAGVLAIASLSFLPALFAFFVWVAALVWTAGLVLWTITIWRVARGGEWRIPVAATWADRLTSVGRTTVSGPTSA